LDVDDVDGSRFRLIEAAESLRSGGETSHLALAEIKSGR
jgi:hypothetical protein